MLGSNCRSVPVRLLLLLSLVATGVFVLDTPVEARVAQATPEYANPRIPNNYWAIDPFILKVDDTYHAYFSGMAFAHVPYATSTDNPATPHADPLQNWTFHLDPEVPLLTDLGNWVDTAAGNIASPSVVEISSTSYVMYFTAVHNGTGGVPAGKKCIGVAVSDSPEGQFRGTGTPLVCPAGGVEEGAMEPSPVSGTLLPQIFYRRTGANPGIYTQALETTWLTPHGAFGAPVRIFTAADETVWPEGKETWKDGSVEDPTVVIPPGGGNPYLIFSGTDPVTGVRQVGAVDCPGGWGMALVNDCDDVPIEGGRLFASTAARTVGGTTHPGIVGPSGSEVFSDGQNFWLAYDARRTSCTVDCGGMYIDKLCFADGAPRTNAPSPTSDLTRESTCAQDIPSDWMTTWATGIENGFYNLHPRFQNETWRQMVHSATGGSAVRVKLSNRGNTQPLTINAASVAAAHEQQNAGAPSSQVNGPTTALTFGGAASMTIPANGELYSDAVWLTISDDHDVAVSVHIPSWPKRNLRLVVADPAPSALTDADKALRDHYLALDDTVALVDDAAAAPTTGVDLVLISPSAASGALGTKYAGISIPVVNLSASSWQGNGLVNATPTPTSGTTASAPNAIDISGFARFTRTLLDPPDTLHYAAASNLGSGALRVWTTATGSTDTIVAAYDTNAAMPSGAAPARRVAVGLSAGAVLHLTTDGWKALDAATEWAKPRYVNKAGSTFGDETSFVGSGNLVTHTGGGSEFANGGNGFAQNVQFVASVEVLTTSPRGTVVVIADSLTDGSFALSGFDQESMWPARLNNVLNAPTNPQKTSLVNVAIIGNTLLNGDKTAPAFPVTDPLSVLGRFNRDVLSHAGVKTVFVEIGANDLVGDPADNVPAGRSANDILLGLDQLVDRASAAGVRVVVAKVPPYAWRSKTVKYPEMSDPDVENAPKYWLPCYGNLPWTAANETVPTAAEQGFEAQRVAVNTRITTPQLNDPQFAAVVDFDAALRWGTLTAGVDRPHLDHLDWDCIHLKTGTAAAGQPIIGQEKLAATVPTSVLIP